MATRHLHQTRQGHRIGHKAKGDLAPIHEGDLDAVITTHRWSGRGLLCHRCFGVRSSLQCNKLWTPFSGQMTRPEISAPPRQQYPRKLVTPRCRRTLAVTPEALLNDPHLVSICPVSPKTLFDNRKNLDLRSEFRGCHKFRVLPELSNYVRPPYGRLSTSFENYVARLVDLVGIASQIGYKCSAGRYEANLM